MLLGRGVLLVALWLTLVVNRRETGAPTRRASAPTQEPLGKEGGFELVLQDPYLLWIAVLIILLNIVNTVGGFLLNQIVEEAAARFGDRRTRTVASGSSSPPSPSSSTRA